MDIKQRDAEIDKQIEEDENLEPEDLMSDEEYLESENYELALIEDENGKKRFGWIRKDGEEE